MRFCMGLQNWKKKLTNDKPNKNFLEEQKMVKIQSVEPNIADLANGWLRSYRLDYKLEQESLNTEIDQALNDYASKSDKEINEILLKDYVVWKGDKR